MNRRRFIAKGILSGTVLAAPQMLHSPSYIRKRTFRIAHITDMHVMPGRLPERGISRLVKELNHLDDKPDFIINTGDNIMDALNRSKKQVAEQWETWNNIFLSQIDYDIYHCIGNHDVWGWGSADESLRNDPLYGKGWAKLSLQMNSTWYSFIRNGWKFICLDSVAYGDKNHSYIAQLGVNQLKWLNEELKCTPPAMPVMVASHIPILSPATFFDGRNEKTGNWSIPEGWMHLDARKIKDLFYKYPNVKAAISGHIHLADQTRYLNVDYFCNGSACGRWWTGKYQEFGPAYALLDLFNDGSVECALVHYDWK